MFPFTHGWLGFFSFWLGDTYNNPEIEIFLLEQINASTIAHVFKKCLLTFLQSYAHSSMNSNFCSYIKNYIICTKLLASSSENMNESSVAS